MVARKPSKWQKKIFIVSKLPNIPEKILKINKKIFYLLVNRQFTN